MRILRSVSLLALACAAVASQATVIDFENLVNDGPNGFTPYSNVVFSGGFAFASEGQRFAAWNASDGGQNYTGSTALFADGPNSTITMSRVGGGAFTLSSMQLANLFTGTTSMPLTFTGTKVGGGTVTNEFTFDGSDALQTDTFVGFTDLLTVSWVQGADFGNPHQFDNIDVTPLSTAAVPGPMAALPFALMALKRRKRA